MVEPACASRRLLGRFWQLSLQDFTYRSDTIHMPEPCSLQATLGSMPSSCLAAC